MPGSHYFSTSTPTRNAYFVDSIDRRPARPYPPHSARSCAPRVVSRWKQGVAGWRVEPPGLRPNPTSSPVNSRISPVDRSRLLTAPSNVGGQDAKSQPGQAHALPFTGRFCRTATSMRCMRRSASRSTSCSQSQDPYVWHGRLDYAVGAAQQKLLLQTEFLSAAGWTGLLERDGQKVPVLTKWVSEAVKERQGCILGALVV